MENLDFLDKLFSKKQIANSTKKNYKYYLTKLNDGDVVKNLKFLEDSNLIIDSLKDKSPTVRKNYLASISSALGLSKRNKKLDESYKIYKKELETVNKDISSKSNIATDNIKDNWITKDEVQDNIDKLSKLLSSFKRKKILTDTEYNILLKLVVLSLYVLIPPRREADYTYMLIQNDNSGDDNIFNLREKTFTFRKYKTKNIYGDQIISIPPDLLGLLNLYYSIISKRYNINKLPVNFLIWGNGKPFKRNDIYHILSDIFGKKVGSTQLRRLYLTNAYQGIDEQMQQDAEMMATTPSTIKKYYVKKNV